MTFDTASLQKALLNPEIYPDHPKEVGFFETHISLLFFTGNHVYKVKKPVDFGFLDFTSLEKRKYFCEREVTLNRRLSPKIYLGVVVITQDEDRVKWGGSGEVVEYAVQMKQIPEGLLMDRLLKNNKVTTLLRRPMTISDVLQNQNASNRIRMRTSSRPGSMLM
jgi:aminoglycoside phosphotransferase family enzyme